MILNDALTNIIDIGIEAVKSDYADRPDKRDGAILGFNECRDKTPAEIAALLHEANQKTIELHRARAPDYWYWRCRAAEIEWVANVVSAILMNEGLPVIVQPTCRGMLMAARVIGVAA